MEKAELDPLKDVADEKKTKANKARQARNPIYRLDALVKSTLVHIRLV